MNHILKIASYKKQMVFPYFVLFFRLCMDSLLLSCLGWYHNVEIFFLQRYNATTHFETMVQDVLAMYTLITTNGIEAIYLNLIIFSFIFL